MMRTGALTLQGTLLQLWYSNMTNCLSRVRGWWVRGQRRGRALPMSRTLQKTVRQGMGSQRGGGSSHITWPGETQWHRSESDTLTTPVIICLKPGMHHLVCFHSLSHPSFVHSLVLQWRVLHRCQTSRSATPLQWWSTMVCGQEVDWGCDWLVWDWRRGTAYRAVCWVEPNLEMAWLTVSTFLSVIPHRSNCYLFYFLPLRIFCYIFS